MKSEPQTTKTAAERLAAALTGAQASGDMIDRAAKGFYGDFTSPLATPISELVMECKSKGMNDIAERAMNGEFDGR